jgi:hypothetical protein
MSAALGRAAIAYAHRLGWRVLPCEPGGKRAILKDWPARATTDPSTIRSWWARTPEANVAVATGPGSGVLVLDVDGEEGERSLAALERQHGPLPDLYPMQWTGSGGGRWQGFFSYPASRELGNSVGALGSKLDTRGAGGYTVLPPSMTTQPYEWAEDRSPADLPPEPAPDWLLDLLDPPAIEPPPFQSDAYRPRAYDRYGWRALEAELALVVTASEGRRNDQLNRSAHALYRLVKDGRLYRSDVDHGLLAAALHIGLNQREAASTMASAARARGLNP